MSRNWPPWVYRLTVRLIDFFWDVMVILLVVTICWVAIKVVEGFRHP